MGLRNLDYHISGDWRGFSKFLAIRFWVREGNRPFHSVTTSLSDSDATSISVERVLTTRSIMGSGSTSIAAFLLLTTVVLVAGTIPKNERDCVKLGKKNPCAKTTWDPSQSRCLVAMMACRPCPKHLLAKKSKNACCPDCIPKVHPCDRNNGGCSFKCKKDGKKARCLCPPESRLRKDGKTCEKIPAPVHPCDRNNGGCSFKCKEIGKKARCLCRPGSRLRKDGKTCEKITAPVHLCDRNNGGCSFKCKKIGKRARCLCRPGSRLRKDGKT